MALKDLFKAADPDSRGTVTPRRFRSILARYGIHSGLNPILKRFQRGGDVDYDSFLTYFERSKERARSQGISPATTTPTASSSSPHTGSAKRPPPVSVDVGRSGGDGESVDQSSIGGGGLLSLEAEARTPRGKRDLRNVDRRSRTLLGTGTSDSLDSVRTQQPRLHAIMDELAGGTGRLDYAAFKRALALAGCDVLHRPEMQRIVDAETYLLHGEKGDRQLVDYEGVFRRLQTPQTTPLNTPMKTQRRMVESPEREREREAEAEEVVEGGEEDVSPRRSRFMPRREFRKRHSQVVLDTHWGERDGEKEGEREREMVEEDDVGGVKTPSRKRRVEENVNEDSKIGVHMKEREDANEMKIVAEAKEAGTPLSPASGLSNLHRTLLTTASSHPSRLAALLEPFDRSGDGHLAPQDLAKGVAEIVGKGVEGVEGLVEMAEGVGGRTAPVVDEKGRVDIRELAERLTDPSIAPPLEMPTTVSTPQTPHSLSLSHHTSGGQLMLAESMTDLHSSPQPSIRTNPQRGAESPDHPFLRRGGAKGVASGVVSSELRGRLCEGADRASETLQGLWKRFDVDRDGVLTPEELRRGVQDVLRVPLTDAEFSSLLASTADRSTGLIAFHPFARAFGGEGGADSRGGSNFERGDGDTPSTPRRKVSLSNWKSDVLNQQLKGVKSKGDGGDGDGETEKECYDMAAANSGAIHRTTRKSSRVHFESSKDPSAHPILTPRERKDAALRRKISDHLRGRFANLSLPFRRFDRDGNGVISRAELQNGLRDVGVDLTIADTERLFTYIDRDRSGAIDYVEFAALFGGDDRTEAGERERTSGRRASERFEDEREDLERGERLRDWQLRTSIADKIRQQGTTIRSAFRRLDTNSDGRLDAGEFTRGVTEVLGVPLSPSEITWLRRRCDTNHDGYIEFDELARTLEEDRHPFGTPNEKSSAAENEDVAAHLKSHFGGTVGQIVRSDSMRHTDGVDDSASGDGERERGAETPRDRVRRSSLLFQKSADEVRDDNLRDRLVAAIEARGAGVRDVFLRLDAVERGGAVAVEELGEAMRERLGVSLDDAEVRAIARRCDSDGDGSIDFAEFARWIGDAGRERDNVHSQRLEAEGAAERLKPPHLRSHLGRSDMAAEDTPQHPQHTSQPLEVEIPEIYAGSDIGTPHSTRRLSFADVTDDGSADGHGERERVRIVRLRANPTMPADEGVAPRGYEDYEGVEPAAPYDDDDAAPAYEYPETTALESDRDRDRGHVGELHGPDGEREREKMRHHTRNLQVHTGVCTSPSVLASVRTDVLEAAEGRPLKVIEGFRALDPHGEGVLPHDRFARVLTGLGVRTPAWMVEQVVSDFGGDYGAFVRATLGVDVADHPQPRTMPSGISDLHLTRDTTHDFFPEKEELHPDERAEKTPRTPISKLWLERRKFDERNNRSNASLVAGNDHEDHECKVDRLFAEDEGAIDPEEERRGRGIDAVDDEIDMKRKRKVQSDGRTPLRPDDHIFGGGVPTAKEAAKPVASPTTAPRPKTAGAPVERARTLTPHLVGAAASQHPLYDALTTTRDLREVLRSTDDRPEILGADKDRRLAQKVMKRARGRLGGVLGAFERADRDGNGRVSYHGFVDGLKRLGVYMSDRDLVRTVGAFDDPSSGRPLVNYREFAARMQLEDLRGIPAAARSNADADALTPSRCSRTAPADRTPHVDERGMEHYGPVRRGVANLLSHERAATPSEQKLFQSKKRSATTPGEDHSTAPTTPVSGKKHAHGPPDHLSTSLPTTEKSAEVPDVVPAAGKIGGPDRSIKLFDSRRHLAPADHDPLDSKSGPLYTAPESPSSPKGVKKATAKAFDRRREGWKALGTPAALKQLVGRRVYQTKESVTEAFRALDVDGDGRVGVDDLVRGLARFNLRLNERQAKKLIRACSDENADDGNGESGGLSLARFAEHIQPYEASRPATVAVVPSRAATDVSPRSPSTPPTTTPTSVRSSGRRKSNLWNRDSSDPASDSHRADDATASGGKGGYRKNANISHDPLYGVFIRDQPVQRTRNSQDASMVAALLSQGVPNVQAVIDDNPLFAQGDFRHAGDPRLALRRPAESRCRSTPRNSSSADNPLASPDLSGTPRSNGPKASTPRGRRRMAAMAAADRSVEAVLSPRVVDRPLRSAGAVEGVSTPTPSHTPSRSLRPPVRTTSQSHYGVGGWDLGFRAKPLGALHVIHSKHSVLY